jgi:hypothetical protein
MQCVYILLKISKYKSVLNKIGITIDLGYLFKLVVGSADANSTPSTDDDCKVGSGIYGTNVHLTTFS